MIYVGIDPGSKNCALVAWSPPDELITTWKPRGAMPKGVLRLDKLRREIRSELLKLDTVHAIAVEGYSMAERYGQHASGEIGATIKLAILDVYGSRDLRAFPTFATPQQLKKFATGNGNAKKDMICKEVLKRWGVDFDDTNLADAYVLARLAHAVHAKPEITAFQQQVVEKVWSERPEGMLESMPIRRLKRLGGRGGAKART